MLSRTNRIRRAEDFRRIVRSGRRSVTGHAVVYAARSQSDDPVRFGFIVAKTVGDSVRRNLVTRRLRSIARDSLRDRSTGLDIVVRALPGSAEAPWSTLQGEIASALSIAGERS